ncbi:hypothetical protein AMJ47_00375 [Parcubacteria bacterium DG_72]|nr:MAG: hypothetical protein AMJ47_00375 [Parcubacteria bacterium DG_72]
MQYKIIGKGGQGVLFLSKVIAEALLLTGAEDFSFLKEFDEGQRSGEIKITFNIPFDLKDKEIEIKNHNMIELRKVVEDLNLNKDKVETALKKLNPQDFENNLKIWLNE